MDKSRKACIKEMTLERGFEGQAGADIEMNEEGKACCGEGTLLRTLETLSHFNSPSGRCSYPLLVT